jgi:hypothetical protein
MMKLLTIILSLAFSLPLYGQVKTVRTLQINDTIAFAAVDRPGELYLLTKTGQLQKFDKDGNLLNLHKGKHTPTLFDPRDGSRLFAYIRELRQYWFLSPSFEITTAHELDSAFAIDPWLICPSGDHNIWVLDAADNSLKKIDTKTGNVTVEISASVKSKENVGYMREYQGFLFVLDREKGILIFSSIGKLIRVLPGKDIPFFNFLGEELYYSSNGKMQYFNLFSAETRESVLPGGSRILLLTDERQFNVRALDVVISTAPAQ